MISEKEIHALIKDNSGCIPIFSKKHLSFYREEKLNYISVISKKHGELGQLELNETCSKILHLCDGKSNIGEIYKKFIKEFKDDECFNEIENTIKKDFEQIIFKLYFLGVIYWLHNKSPYIKEYNLNIDEDIILRNGHENNIHDIFKLIEKSDINREYINPFIENNVLSEVSIRYALFNFTSEYVLIYKKEKVVGVIEVSIPRNKMETSAEINFIISPNELIDSAIKYIIKNISNISLIDISKIKFYIKPSDNKYSDLIDILKKNNFKKEGLLKNEFGKEDVEIYSYIF